MPPSAKTRPLKPAQEGQQSKTTASRKRQSSARTGETIFYQRSDYSDYLELANRPLRLLCLDGGGVRGLSSLRILKNLMEKLDPDSPPKPCHIFDLIGGTSTGGLMAIMLGRLEMDVDSCIETYLRMSRKVFSNPKSSNIFKYLKEKWHMLERLDSKILEECMKEVVEITTGDKDILMKQENNPRCRVFVCALSTLITEPVCIRTYRPRELDAIVPGCTIWEAARATSAASTFFNAIKVGDYGEEFSDGAVTENNPINLVLREAEDIWPNARNRIQRLLSIGTGNPGVHPFGGNLVKVGKTLVRIATQTEKTARVFADSHSDLREEGRYFRFNVDDGLQEVGLEEHEQIGLIAAATSKYLDLFTSRKSLKECTRKLKVNLAYPADAFDPEFPSAGLGETPRSNHDDRCELLGLPKKNDGPFGDNIWACHGPHYLTLRFSVTNLPIGVYHVHWSVAGSTFTLPANLQIDLRCEKLQTRHGTNIPVPTLGVDTQLRTNLSLSSAPQFGYVTASVEKIASETLATFSGKWLTISSKEPISIERHDDYLFFKFEINKQFLSAGDTENESDKLYWTGDIIFGGLGLTCA